MFAWVASSRRSRCVGSVGEQVLPLAREQTKDTSPYAGRKGIFQYLVKVNKFKVKKNKLKVKTSRQYLWRVASSKSQVVSILKEGK